jgi:hypothetical protein
MPQTILGQMLEKVQFLEPDELQQLNHAVQNRLINQNQEETAKYTAFHQALLNAGLVRQIKKVSYQKRERLLVQVQEQPISTTIAKERR